MESKFEDFLSLKENYASYHIATIPGNRGRHGNVMSEINHSSVLSFLNNGNKYGNEFCENPMLLIRELMRRQRKHTQRKNLQLFGWKQDMKVEVKNLMNEPDTTSRSDLLLAAEVLNKDQYSQYKSNQLRAITELDEKKQHAR